jgi:hypothetical protein
VNRAGSQGRAPPSTRFVEHIGGDQPHGRQNSKGYDNQVVRIADDWNEVGNEIDRATTTFALARDELRRLLQFHRHNSPLVRWIRSAELAWKVWRGGPSFAIVLPGRQMSGNDLPSRHLRAAPTLNPTARSLGETFPGSGLILTNAGASTEHGVNHARV